MKKLWPLVLLLVVILPGMLVLAPTAWTGPLVQGTVTPRPTLPPTGPDTPTPDGARAGAPLDSQIALALVVDKAEAEAGDPLNYKAQVSNTAGQEATNVWLTFELPAGIEVRQVESTLGEVHRYDRQIAVELGRLQPSFDAHYVTIAAVIDEDLAPGTVLANHANLTSDQAGGGERTVETVIRGQAQATAAPTAAPAQGEGGAAMPTSGGGAAALGAAIGFIVLAVAVALLTWRKPGIH